MEKAGTQQNVGGTSRRAGEIQSNFLNNTQANVSRYRNNYVDEANRDSQQRASSQNNQPKQSQTKKLLGMTGGFAGMSQLLKFGNK